MPYLRGRLNTQAYVNTNLSRGNWHQLVCDYEPFQFDNQLNQIVKYVARQLAGLCRFSDTRRDLEKIGFLLEEVSDVYCTALDCDSIQLNRFFGEYAHCVEMCRFFLEDQYLNRQDAQQRHFCFLVPMDLVYEDFITGVMKQHFSTAFTIQSQATSWLTEQGAFQMRNDLLLTGSMGRIVAYTKYKIRQAEAGDKKEGDE